MKDLRVGAQGVLGSVVGGLVQQLGIDEVRNLVRKLAAADDFWSALATMQPRLEAEVAVAVAQAKDPRASS